MSDTSIQFDSITKCFGGVMALDGVSLSIAAGECHALMGENGAGKSTLGKILAGIHRADGGKVRIGGWVRSIHSPADARAAGIGMVHQELAFCPDLSVAENLCMGQYPRRLGFLINRRAMRSRATELLGRIGVDMEVRQDMRHLSTAQEQLVQIAAAVGSGARILVFDEPTSSLSEPEAQRLFGLIQTLKERGVTMIYVSHRLPEVFRLCDRISVLRDGKYVGTLDRAQATQDKLVRMMVGRRVDVSLSSAGLSPPPPMAQPLLEVNDLCSPGRFRDITFCVPPGQIVGLAGLVGSGRSEVAQAIFGLDPAARGSVSINGAALKLGSVRSAMKAGLGLVPEDRKRQGLVLDMGGRANYSLAMLDRLHCLGILRYRREKIQAMEAFERLRVKMAGIDAPVSTLSGGNQQKVVLAKWLGRGGKALIVDEPTRGVDVGAKVAIHQILLDLAKGGLAIVVISSELPELLLLCHRILVMRQGRLVGEVSGQDASQERLLRLMAGVADTAMGRS